MPAIRLGDTISYQHTAVLPGLALDTCMDNFPEGVQRVTAALRDQDHPHAPVMLDDAARTAQQAADALGIQLGQIAKSIIFRRKADGAAGPVVRPGEPPAAA